MQPKHEQALVGMFVLIAVAVLFATVFTMSGAFGRSTTKFHAYFSFAGGLEPGATVRYAGGPKVGRVEVSRGAPLHGDWHLHRRAMSARGHRVTRSRGVCRPSAGYWTSTPPPRAI